MSGAAGPGGERQSQPLPQFPHCKACGGIAGSEGVGGRTAPLRAQRSWGAVPCWGDY